MLASAGIALAALLCLAALAVLLATATGARADDEPDDEPDITHYDQLPPDRAWRDSIRLRSVRGYDGEDVTVAVIDTGITHHPDVDELEARVDLMPDGDGYDRYGHGTHIAGVIAGDGEASDGRWAGVAPEASILPIRVADWNGATDVSAALVAREPARHGRRRGRLGVGGGVVDRDRRLERCRRSGVRAIALATAIAERFPLDLHYRNARDVYSLAAAIWTGSLLLVEPSVLAIAVASGVLVGESLERRPPVKVAFNVGQFTLAISAALAVFEALGSPPADEPATWLAAAAAMATFQAVNTARPRASRRRRAGGPAPAAEPRVDGAGDHPHRARTIARKGCGWAPTTSSSSRSRSRSCSSACTRRPAEASAPRGRSQVRIADTGVLALACAGERSPWTCIRPEGAPCLGMSSSRVSSPRSTRSWTGSPARRWKTTTSSTRATARRSTSAAGS